MGWWLAETYLGAGAAELIRFAPPDPAACLHVFRDAMLGDDASARYQVGLLLLHRAAQRVEQELREAGFSFGNYSDAVDLLRKAEREVPAARARLGQLIWRGVVKPRYPEEPLELLESAAADGGCAPAMHTLDRAYRDGNGVSVDAELARRWRDAALAEKEPRTSFDMGLALEAGDGVKTDTLAALRMFAQALAHAPRELPGLAADAREKMRAMVLRNRAELTTSAATSSADEWNDRIAIELSSDDQGDQVPDYSRKLGEAVAARENPTPADILRAMVQLNPSAARRLRLI